jgi:mycothiol synthase
MTFIAKPYEPETDFARVRDFLTETHAPYNWTTDHWDYARYYTTQFVGLGYKCWESDIRLWETEGGELVGAVMHEGERGEVSLQSHPLYREVEAEMIEWAERKLWSQVSSTQRYLNVWAYDNDATRQSMLYEHRYQPVRTYFSHKYQRSLDGELPEVLLPEGYTLRNMREDDNLCERCYVLGRAFGGANPLCEEVYQSLQSAPGYRRDLDLVITDPTGAFAAFALVWHDRVNGTGTFEPVGVDPDHQRKGLGRAVMFEGMRRLQALGAKIAYVTTDTAEGANGLYQSVGFEIADVNRVWKKMW